MPPLILLIFSLLQRWSHDGVCERFCAGVGAGGVECGLVSRIAYAASSYSGGDPGGGGTVDRHFFRFWCAVSLRDCGVGSYEAAQVGGTKTMWASAFVAGGFIGSLVAIYSNDKFDFEVIRVSDPETYRAWGDAIYGPLVEEWVKDVLALAVILLFRQRITRPTQAFSLVRLPDWVSR
ncbi:PrsW family glutamic-type intramembrane protease [Corynebacterium belfantii]|uniref:PrsW family glutamic-type intramembrane protease n=1 Tax=Corynebacterium belfantii TaxID=2014537 RepID=UPI0018CB4C02|nr:PrsW family glutamic-type intramembrane protease [Corynebacterium belfantii]MBG9287555.1 hypothetical protein [Corynebacterium belfantii]